MVKKNPSTKGVTLKNGARATKPMILPNPCLPSCEYPLHDSDTVGGSEIRLTSFSHYLQGFHTCWVVQNFFHQQYCSDFKFLPDKMILLVNLSYLSKMVSM